MAIAKLERMLEFDLGQKTVPWKARRAAGKALRDEVPRESHAEWRPAKNRPDPIATLLASNKGRQEHLIPLRMGRMAASPFVFCAAPPVSWRLTSPRLRSAGFLW
jgi:hypothetical protein